MDPPEAPRSEELLQFFHRKKTEMSCMEKPRTFLGQLRDHNLIPEDRYKKVSRMKSKESLKRGVYELLDWLETNRSQHIHDFWTCVSEDVIINQYPTLRLLRNSLMDGSYRDHIRSFEKAEKKQTSENRRKDAADQDEEPWLKKKKLRNVVDGDSDDEQQLGPSSRLRPRQKNSSKKEEKRNLRSERVCGAGEHPGPSSRLAPAVEGASSSIMKKGEKNVPVTCGDLQGALSKSKLAKGQKCICSNKRWFTPNEFESHAGKQSNKNWKWSIRCGGVPLGKLIQDGRLTVGSFKRRSSKAKFPPEQDVTASDGDDSEDEDDQTSSDDEDGSTVDSDAEGPEQQQAPGQDGSSATLRVTCGAVTATLHRKRFASGSSGMSIRTETRWMTPEEFVRKASAQTDACWKKDITCEGKPLGLLIQEKLLKSHSLLCDCPLCLPEDGGLESQRNDDECSVCRSEEGAELVVCDSCPRSFHQTCHLPHIDDATLSDHMLWRCSFCEAASRNDGPELDLPAAMSQLVPGHMLKCQYLLLRLCSAEAERTPPPSPVQSCSTAAPTPEWFHEMAQKLQGARFQTVGDFVSDVRLIFNQDDGEGPGQRTALKELFEGEFRKVFKICD